MVYSDDEIIIGLNLTYNEVYSGSNQTALFRLDSLPIIQENDLLVSNLNNIFVVQFVEEGVSAIFQVNSF